MCKDPQPGHVFIWAQGNDDTMHRVGCAQLDLADAMRLGEDDDSIEGMNSTLNFLLALRAGIDEAVASYQETIDVMMDPEAVADLAEAEQDLSDGKTVDLSQVRGLRQADVASDGETLGARSPNTVTPREMELLHSGGVLTPEADPDYVAVGVSRPLADEILTPENDPETAELQRRFIDSGVAAQIDEWVDNGAPGVRRERPLRPVTEYEKSRAVDVPLPPDSELL